MSYDINTLGQAITATAASSTSGVSATTKETSMGKEDFLTLLVAQLQNQDPLNPDDPTEFTAQLAQFSSLEQLFTLNESMENLVASNAASESLSALSTLGKEVTYLGDTFNYEGFPVEVGYQLDGIATEVTLSLQQNGATVASLNGTDLTEGNHFISWNGLTEEGKTAPSGEYKIVISAKAVDGESVAAAPLVKSEVTGIDMDVESGGILVTQSGSINFNKIFGVYEPEPTVSTTDENQTKEFIAETLDTVTGVTDKEPEIVK
jgi:flagellar basal-body rod modification protein FlgD